MVEAGKQARKAANSAVIVVTPEMRLAGSIELQDVDAAYSAEERAEAIYIAMEIARICCIPQGRLPGKGRAHT